MMHTLCEPVKPPKKMMQFYEYFCGSTNEIDNTEKLKKTQKQRFMFYKMTSTLVRAYVDLANDMEKAGYTKDEIKKIKFQVKDYNETKEAIKLRSGETIDLKKYEPDMRYLIDNYIDAEESKNVKVFEEVPLVDLIVKSGIHSIIDFLPSKTKEDKKNSADTINANIRKVITAGKQELPKFYERMSKRLDEIIIQYNKNTEEYQTYLKNIDNLCKEWLNGVNSSEYPNKINTKPRMAFYDLLENEELAVKMDTVIIENKHDEWKGNPMKEKILKNCIKDALKKEEIEDDSMTEKIFELAQRQNEY
jgi:type I restriction enzyme R subunit